MNTAALPGETDLVRLLAGLSPSLWETPRLIRHQPPEATLPPHAILVFREAEGTTVIESIADHDAHPGEPLWAQITLRVHSSLEAVGMMAAVGHALAEAGVPCNVVSAYAHDHLFVPWAQRDTALDALHRLSTAHR